MLYISIAVFMGSPPHRRLSVYLYLYSSLLSLQCQSVHSMKLSEE